MRTCPELAAVLKKRKADQLEQLRNQTINLIDNFGDDDDSDFQGKLKPNSDLAVNVIGPNLANHYSNPSNEAWYIDSGVTKHVTGHENLLTEFGPGNKSKVSTTGGEILHVVGIGNVEIFTDLGESNLKIFCMSWVLQKTYYLLALFLIAKPKEWFFSILIRYGYFGTFHCQAITTS